MIMNVYLFLRQCFLVDTCAPALKAVLVPIWKTWWAVELWTRQMVHLWIITTTSLISCVEMCCFFSTWDYFLNTSGIAAALQSTPNERPLQSSSPTLVPKQLLYYYLSNVNEMQKFLQAFILMKALKMPTVKHLETGKDEEPCVCVLVYTTSVRNSWLLNY